MNECMKTNEYLIGLHKNKIIKTITIKCTSYMTLR